MDNKKTFLIVAGVGVLVAASSFITFKAVSNSALSKAEEKVKAEEAYYDETVKYIKDNIDNIDTVEAEMIKRMPNLSLDQSNAIVDILVYNAYASAQTTEITDEDSEKIFAALDANSHYDADIMQDGETKDKITDAIKNHAMVTFLNGNLALDIDYGYFVDYYGEYMDADYRDLMSFYRDSREKDYYLADTDTLDFAQIDKLLNSIHYLEKTYPESDLISLFKQEENLWMSILLGGYEQSYVFNSDKTIRNEMIDGYKTLISSTEDEKLKEVLTELVDMYEQAGNIKTVPISEFIKKYCGDAVYTVDTPEATQAQLETDYFEPAESVDGNIDVSDVLTENETVAGIINDDGSVTLDDGRTLQPAGITVESSAVATE